jgi:hypothetical protein
VFKKKSVLTIVILALAFSMLAFTASASEVKDGWQWDDGVGAAQKLFFYRNGARVVGPQEVPLPAAWWPAQCAVPCVYTPPTNPTCSNCWGEAPTTAWFFFATDGSLVRAGATGWREFGDGNQYHLSPIYTLAMGWHWDSLANTFHYMQPHAATGISLATGIPARWTYDTERVTHRWFDFVGERGALNQTRPNGWDAQGRFWFGYGVTQGWVNVPGAPFAYATTERPAGLYYFGAGATPTLETGSNREILNPWTGDVRRFNFGANGRLTSAFQWVPQGNLETQQTFNVAVENLFGAITFIIIEENVAPGSFGIGATQRAFRLSAGPVASAIVLREGDLHEQAGGGWRIAIPGTFNANQIQLETFR